MYLKYTTVITDVVKKRRRSQSTEFEMEIGVHNIDIGF